MSKQVFGAILFAAPLVYGAWCAHKKGYLKPALQGLGIGCAALAWFAFCIWLGTP